ncbi:hypothetical protein LEP1GSC061_0350 [Leptospira wolffii serovar Khorat str. Khorat-H2]|nr:hypothetical protein LEP1GSC061_0350 [Leptospira wolffii serovar Khorat str. Khorat-H2]
MGRNQVSKPRTLLLFLKRIGRPSEFVGQKRKSGNFQLFCRNS